MKIGSYIIGLIVLVTPLICTASDQVRILNVIYYSFDLQPIAGIPEKSLEEIGCKYTISSQDFEKSITDINEFSKKIKYNEYDIRAKVIINDKKSIIIDQNGYIKGNETKRIQKILFTSKLKRKLERCG